MNAFLDRAQSIFFAAIEKHAPGEWPAFLDEACGGEAELRRYVEQLLESHVALGSIHAEASPPSNDTLDQSVQHVGALIGPFKLLEQIGEGGMGTVFVAQQSEPLKRLVALKIIKPGMDTRQVIARFEAERQALALMDHPNIAKVLDAGTTDAGRPYFVMELVKGVPITQYCDQHHLTPKQRLELFVPVCQAIQHAHQKGIIHRDLKPSNVLVALYDDQPVPKVIDFGVAKATGQQLTEQTLHTGFGAVVGTLEYMSPEQATFNQLDVDTRSDIYSLGVLLYELLAGSPHFSRQNLEQAGLLEMLRLIREQEPSKPSTKLSSSDALPTLSANRGTEPARLTKQLRGELDWIVMKALDKDRARRYETANGLVMDIQRYLADEPVQACPPSAWYQMRKFARRNKQTLGVAAALAVAVLVVAGTLGWGIRDREAHAQEAAQERATRQTTIELDVSLALKEAQQWQGQEKWLEALSAAKRAQGLLAGGGSDELRERVGQLRKDLEMVGRLEDIRLRMSEVQTERVFGYEQADRDYGKAFADYGIEIDSLTATEAAERIQKGSVAVQLAAALNDWAMARRPSREDETQWKHLLAVAKLADPDEWRNQFRDAWERRDTAALTKLAGSDKIPTLPAATLYLLGSTLQETGAAQEAFALLRAAHDRHPDDFWINLELGYCCIYKLSPPRVDDAIRFLTAAKAIRKVNPAPDRYLGRAFLDKGALDESITASRQAIHLKPDWFPPYVNLGVALLDRGQLDESISASRQAIELKPDYFAPRTNLGRALQQQGKLDEAIACYRKAIEIDPKIASSHHNLGIALHLLGKLDEAIVAYRDAIEIDPKYAWAHRNLGLALKNLGKQGDAIASYEKAIELKPDDARFNNDLAWLLATCPDPKFRNAARSVELGKKAVELSPLTAAYWNTLGVANYRAGDWTAAVNALRKSTVLRNGGDSLDWYFLAMTHWQQGDKDKAREWRDRANDWMDKNQPKNEELKRFRTEADDLIEKESAPRRVSSRGDSAAPLSLPPRAIELTDDGLRAAAAQWPDEFQLQDGMGRVLVGQGKFVEAEPFLTAAVRLAPERLQGYTQLAELLRHLKKFDEAVALLKQAIERDPNKAWLHEALGWALWEHPKPAEAEQAFREAVRLDPGLANAQFGLGKAYQAQRKFAESIQPLRIALRLNPDDRNIQVALGESLNKLHQHAEAETVCRDMIRNRFDDAEAHHNLSWALLGQKKFAEAEASSREALRLAPKHRWAPQVLADALMSQGKLSEAETVLAELVSREPERPWTHETLGRLLREQKKPAEAEAEFREAVRLQPDLAKAQFGLGQILQDQKKFVEAVGPLREALRLDPTRTNIHGHLGSILIEQKSFTEAEAEFREQVRLAPDRANAHFGLGRVLVEQKKFAEAETSLREVLRLEPKHRWAPGLLKRALVGQDKHAEAEAVKGPP